MDETKELSIVELLALVVAQEFTDEQVDKLKDDMDGDPLFLDKLIEEIHKATEGEGERKPDLNPDKPVHSIR